MIKETTGSNVRMSDCFTIILLSGKLASISSPSCFSMKETGALLIVLGPSRLAAPFSITRELLIQTEHSIMKNKHYLKGKKT
jgi:hypothetical protein